FDPFLVTGNPNAANFSVTGLATSADVSSDRLAGRAELCRLLDKTGGPAGEYAETRNKAINLLTSPAVARAFDVSREPPAIRDRYGRHPHGQSVLLARRLVEAG